MKLPAVPVALAALAASAAAHSNLISPKPRNAIDSLDPRWEGGKSSPDIWEGPPRSNLSPVDGQACACRNGSEICNIGQTCLWMSVGCSLGCAECDGGQNGHGGTNPNTADRCGKGEGKATNNGPSPFILRGSHRTLPLPIATALSLCQYLSRVTTDREQSPRWRRAFVQNR